MELETVVEQRQRSVNDFKLDTVQFSLSRFKPINNLPKLLRIELTTGDCWYGGCNQQNIIIDSSGYYYYEPVKNVDVDTTFQSNQAKSLFDEISTIVSSLSSDDLNFREGISMHEQVLHTHLYFDDGTEMSKFSDYNTVLFPIQSKLIHSINFVKGLRKTKPVKFAIRDTLNNYPL